MFCTGAMHTCEHINLLGHVWSENDSDHLKMGHFYDEENLTKWIEFVNYSGGSVRIATSHEMFMFSISKSGNFTSFIIFGGLYYE